MTEDYAIERPPKMNVRLLTRVLDHIVAHPETWDQSWWCCGTTFCFSGHAAVLNGWKPDFIITNITSFFSRDGKRRRVGDIAREALGLTRDEHVQLFRGDNSLTDLIDMVESVALIAEMDPEAFA